MLIPIHGVPCDYCENIPGTNCASWRCPKCGKVWTSPSQARCTCAVQEDLLPVIPTNTCKSCGKPFVCEVSNGSNSCWCFSLENKLTVDPNQRCLCRDCLSARLASLISVYE